MLPDPPLRLLAAYQSQMTQPPEQVLQVPEREMWIAAQFNDSGVHAYTAADLDSSTSFNPRTARKMRTIVQRPLPRWSRPVASVTAILSEEGLILPGIFAVLAGDEPAGPRYDHALAMAAAVLWLIANNRPIDSAELIAIVDRALRRYPV